MLLLLLIFPSRFEIERKTQRISCLAATRGKQNN